MTQQIFNGTIIRILDNGLIIVKVEIPKDSYVREACSIQLYKPDNKEGKVE